MIAIGCALREMDLKAAMLPLSYLNLNEGSVSEGGPIDL